VHFTPGAVAPRPGDVVVAEVTSAAPHHLVSDLAVDGVRRTRAGDAWQARQAGSSDTDTDTDTHTDTDAVRTGDGPAPVLLGLPTLRA
jgi:hypothetical protein